jgi:ribonucleoside-triphosphate reductase
MQVTKRDGRKVEFDSIKIEKAITKAFIEIDGVVNDSALEIINRICEQITSLKKDYDVEQIQDIIENKLMSSNRKDIAKAYMLYRDRRHILRESKKRKENILSIINNTNKTLREENSNKNIKLLPTQRDYMAGESCKEISELFIPDRIMKAHKEGIIHFHDMDYSPAMSMYNCSLINLEDMLQNGTVISEVKIDKPKKILYGMYYCNANYHSSSFQPIWW